MDTYGLRDCVELAAIQDFLMMYISIDPPLPEQIINTL
jgi:hypothetical protein